MKKLTILFVFVFGYLNAALAQTNSCGNIIIDSFTGKYKDTDDYVECGVRMVTTAGVAPGVTDATECTGTTNAISGATEVWLKNKGAGPSQALAGNTEVKIWGEYGVLDIAPGAASVTDFIITYDGADGNTDPDNPNLTGPVLGDFTGKKIQFILSFDGIGQGENLTFKLNVWDAAGNKSTASYTVNTVNAGQSQVNDQLVDMGVLQGLANLADIRAVQFAGETTENGLDISIKSLTAVCPNTTLPVTLVTFAGKYNENQIALTWKTSSEANADHFEVEQSFTGTTFNKVGEVKAVGNSGAIENYNFTIDSKLDKTTYFRLKMVDSDETFAYSRIIHVKPDGKNSNTEHLSVYPTIFTDALTLSMPEVTSSKAQVKIYGINGDLRHTGVYTVVNSEVSLQNLSNLTNGMYIVQVASGSLIQSQKVIKQ